MRRLTLTVQWIRIVVIVSVLGAGACRNSGGEEATNTVPTAPPDTTTTTALGYAVPETIDVAYVERVMAALDHLEGEAVRRAAAMRQLDQEFYEYFLAMYNPKYFELATQAWEEIADSGFESLAPQPKDPETTVQRLISARRECIFFAAKRDSSPMFTTPDPPRPQRYVALVPLTPARDPDGRNPTPWIINFDGRYESGREPTPEEVCPPR